MNSRPAWALGLVALMLLAGGCKSRATIADWQSDLQTYVDEQLHGDLNDLRGVLAEDGRPMFRTFGAKDVRKSGDVVGVLLGRHRQDDRPWMIFLTAVTDQYQIEDIRVIAVARDPQTGAYRWRIGPSDQAALRTYLQAHERPSRRLSGERAAPPDYTPFPRPGDRFELTTDGSVTVTETRSGARWVLPPAASTD